MTLFTDVMDGEARRKLFVNAEWKPVNGSTLTESANNKDIVTMRFYYKSGKNNDRTLVKNFPQNTYMTAEIKSEDLDIHNVVKQILLSLGIRTYYIEEDDRDLYTSMEKVIIPLKDYDSKVKPLLCTDSSTLPPTINELANRVEQAIGGIKKRRKLGDDLIFIDDVPVSTDWLNRYQNIVGDGHSVPSVPRLIFTLADHLGLLASEETVKRKLRHHSTTENV